MWPHMPCNVSHILSRSCLNLRCAPACNPPHHAGAAANKALAQNVAAEKVQMYGQAFEKIQGSTGIEDIDALVNSFVSAEDQNYTLWVALQPCACNAVLLF